MSREGIINNYKHLNVLTDKQVDDIHIGTLKVLKEHGVKFCDERALRFLADNGCHVDFEKQVVKFPENIVMDCIEKCPSKFNVKARNSENDIVMESGKVTYFADSPNMQLIDENTWEPRTPNRKEFYDHIKVVAALKNIDWHTCFPIYGFEKIPAHMTMLESNAAKIRMSSKVNQEGSVYDNYKWIFRMAEATGQEIMQLVNPTSPSVYFKDCVDQIYFFTENDIPFCLCSGPMMGASGPATIAGSLIVNNADAIGGIVLAQLLKPGSRLNTVSMIMTLNMRTGAPNFGDVGNFLADAAFNQMWRYYNIPCTGTASAWTSSKQIDYQSGYEMSMAVLIETLTGATNMTFSGGLTAELTGSTIKTVIDEDIIGIVKRFVQGVDVNESAMATDLICQIGHAPSNYLAEFHTLDWWKNETYIPEVADRSPIQDWISSGKKTIINHAKEKVQDILANYQVEKLDDAQEKALETILKEARQEYRSKGLISDKEWELYQQDLNSDMYPFS